MILKKYGRLTLRIKKCSIVMNQSSLCQLLKNFLESMNMDIKDYLILSLSLEDFNPVLFYVPLFTYPKKAKSVCRENTSVHDIRHT